MLLKNLLLKSLILILTLFCTQLSAAQIPRITINNNSNVILTPKAVDLRQGCIGRSLAQLITQHSERDLGLVFLQYSSTCRFDVLPNHNISTYSQACHNVKIGDMLIFTGATLATLRCEDVSYA